MKLSLTAYKLSDGLWAFDHEHQNTIQELLCNGTEKVIDEYFEIDMIVLDKNDLLNLATEIESLS